MTARPLKLHAVGRPGPFPLVAASLLVALAGWLAAAAALVPAAGPLADGRFGAGAPVLAVHLLGVVFFPASVAGASWHLLPVMLRNDLPSPRALRVALLLVGGGVPLAAGVAGARDTLVWIGAGLLATGLAISVATLAALVLGAPAGKTLVASRTGVVLSAFHLVAAFVLGAAVAASSGATVLGVPYERLVLCHLIVAGIGWLTLLVVAVGRTLAPMLALAPAAPPRRLPLAELALAGALWLLLAGIAAGVDALAWAGGLALAAALAPFGVQLARVAGRRRLDAVEGPLAHLLVGAVLLAEGAALALAGLAGALNERRAAAAFAVLLLAGWAGGTIVGHAGKLLSLSAWSTWPPGPRPKQAALYPRRPWAAEVAVFAVGVQLVAAGLVAGSRPALLAGAAALVASAGLALAGALLTVRRVRAGRLA